jgi:hypothetical protein
LGIGDWGLGPIPNPQSPIPNPQSPIPNPQSPFGKKNHTKIFNEIALFIYINIFNLKEK